MPFHIKARVQKHSKILVTLVMNHFILEQCAEGHQGTSIINSHIVMGYTGITPPIKTLCCQNRHFLSKSYDMSLNNAAHQCTLPRSKVVQTGVKHKVGNTRSLLKSVGCAIRNHTQFPLALPMLLSGF